MSTTELILSLECSLLALFILLMIGALVMYKWRNVIPGQSLTSSDSKDRNYIVLPHTNAEPVQVERSIKQVTNGNLENGEDHPLLDNRTDSGRLYFSLKYDETASIITIKLIKGENIPLVTKDETKAFVSVNFFSQKTDPKTGIKENTTSTIYQRTYKYTLLPSDFASYAIRFDVSRFDRFSRKYDVGYVTVSLAELEVDISRETFFTRSISSWKNTQIDTGNFPTSSERLEDSQVLRKVRKDSKAKQRNPQVLWHKLSRAVHAGLYQGLLRGRHESLQWDPFLIIQKYEYNDSDEYFSAEQHKSPNSSRKRQHEFGEEETPDVLHEVLTAATQSPAITISSPPPSDSSPETLQTPVNREFYRLVHSPVLSQSDSGENVTSWSIPETFHFPPTPVRLQSSTVVFQSSPAACRPRHDRLHKLTSLSSNYRKRILRKSRKKGAPGRSKLTRMEPLHRLLYLGKDSKTERSIKRRRADKTSDSED